MIALTVTIILLNSVTSTPNYYENKFESKLQPKYETLAEDVSRIMSETDLKFIRICFEIESKSEMVDEILKAALRRVPGASVTIIGLGWLHNYSIYTEGSHLIIITFDELKIGLSILRKMQSQHHQSHFIFIWEGASPEACQYLLHSIFWNYDILNAVAIVQVTTQERHIITYNPFTKQYIRIPTNVYKRNELFIEKDKNVFGYEMQIIHYRSALTYYRPSNGPKSLKVSHIPFLASTITKVMNATLHLRRPFLKNFKRQEIAEADLLINGRSYIISSYEDMGIEPTISVRRDDICLLVPYKRFRTMNESIYKTLDPIVWICAIAISLPVILCLIFISKIKRHTSWSTIPWSVMGYYLDMSAPTTPKEVAPRLILTTWLLYCVIMSSIFESGLYQGVTMEGRDPQFKNIIDVIRSNYRILINDAFYDATADFINNSSLKDNLEVVSVLDYLYNLESKNTEYAYVERLKRTHRFENIHTKNDLPVFYTMEPCILPMIEMNFVQRGSPFLNRINWIIRQSDENGLFHHWENRKNHPHIKAKRQQLFHRPNAGCLDNLLFIFEYWSYALFVCFLVFIMEFVVKLLKTKTSSDDRKDKKYSPKPIRHVHFQYLE